jgi:hypothetical protein
MDDADSGDEANDIEGDDSDDDVDVDEKWLAVEAAWLNAAVALSAVLLRLLVVVDEEQLPSSDWASMSTIS